MNARLAALGAALVLLPSGAAARSAAQLVRASDRVRAPDAPFSVELTHLTRDTTPARPAARLKVWVTGRERSLARFLAPAGERGKTLLMVGPNLWVSLPATERPLRIAPLQRLVGEVAHADVLRVNFGGDYDAAFEDEDTVDGVMCARLLLTGRAEGVTYARLRYWLARADARPVRAEFYAVSGLLLKTARFTRFAPALGAHRPAEIEITDAVRGDRVSRIVYERYRLEALPDEAFQPSALRWLR